MIVKSGIVVALISFCATLAAAPLPRVHPGSPWYQRIDQAAVHPDSGTMIATLTGLGGFGNNRMQIDFSMHVLYATAGTPTQPIIEIPSANPDDDYYLPDCEALGTPVPLPTGGAIEGQAGYN